MAASTALRSGFIQRYRRAQASLSPKFSLQGHRPCPSSSFPSFTSFHLPTDPLHREVLPDMPTAGLRSPQICRAHDPDCTPAQSRTHWQVGRYTSVGMSISAPCVDPANATSPTDDLCHLASAPRRPRAPSQTGGAAQQRLARTHAPARAPSASATPRRRRRWRPRTDTQCAPPRENVTSASKIANTPRPPPCITSPPWLTPLRPALLGRTGRS